MGVRYVLACTIGNNALDKVWTDGWTRTHMHWLTDGAITICLFCCKKVVLCWLYTWSQKRRIFRSTWSLYFSNVVNLIPSSAISVHKNSCSFLDFEHNNLIFYDWQKNTYIYPGHRWITVRLSHIGDFRSRIEKLRLLIFATTVIWRFCVSNCIF